MPVVVYIGDKLKEVRTRRLLTQVELAEKAKVNHSTVVNIERNQAEPHFRTIRKLAYDLETGEDTYAAYCFYGDPAAKG